MTQLSKNHCIHDIDNGGGGSGEGGGGGTLLGLTGVRMPTTVFPTCTRAEQHVLEIALLLANYQLLQKTAATYGHLQF